ncbi:MAG: hypothetical protein C0617_08225 [Desulfuromonas sp.]|uniref:hypothetical protein n=1 Tax=Desulfuromonas sp. TaxID=892 RepID=UPI000CB36A08|nr:hypothetical protein [Desulfuromonas sp.]PLX84356.1 MAG: hypothetical protein C0617_08225 [Desulfuromonas sp.]
MKETAATIGHVNEKAHSQVAVALLQIAFRTSFVLTIGVIGLIGLWAFAALIGGAVSAGGPFELVQGWFSAVTGL